MTSITATTKHSLKAAPAAVAAKSSSAASSTVKKKAGPTGSSTAPAVGGRRGGAPAIKMSSSPEELQKLVRESVGDEDKVVCLIHDMFQRVIGERTMPPTQLSKPHTATSTTRDRAGAAGDLAFVATKCIGVSHVLVKCGILNELQRALFPLGIETLLTRGGADADTAVVGFAGSKDGGDSCDGAAVGPANNANNKTIKPSSSALSLTSLLDDVTITTNGAGGTSDVTIDSMTRLGGRATPPNSREGSLLLIRALIEASLKTGGQSVIEPYIVGAFLAAALDECASSASHVREAAEDTSSAIVQIASPFSFRCVVMPILLQSLRCSEWRTKAVALDRFTQCATMEEFPSSQSSQSSQSSAMKKQVYNAIPILLPSITSQVWDTKAQVSKNAKTALLAICNTNTNPDIRPTIPALVTAICKPSETNKAMVELMGTTFVVPVDASVLTILCPLLARALKEKLAIHKRAACIVINNMSKLVDQPSAIAPFGRLLVPELEKVAANVQFVEIQQEATKALASLSKALGEYYSEQS